MKVGNGLDPEVELAPVINEKQKDRVLEYIEVGRREGATILTGGNELTGDGHGDGFFIAPTVFDGMTSEMRIAREEIFGPVTGVMRVSSVDEAIRIANSVDYGLSCSIYTHDITNVFKAAQQLEFGLVYVNAPTIGAEIQVPFGGMKNTGNGHREAGPVALDEFTEWKTVAIDFSGKLQKAQMEDS
jgi:alpha-ketoglutaric semialdehyde dehydrogenase